VSLRTEAALAVAGGQVWLNGSGSLVVVTGTDGDRVRYERLTGPGRHRNEISVYTLTGHYEQVEIAGGST
jgi:hypothetical protein